MQLRHLQTFVAVAETLNLTRAGERLHLAQSTVSEQIQALESDLGAALFDRGRRRWALTPAGRRLLDYAAPILALSHEARHEVAATARTVAGRIAVGGIDSLCLGRLPRLLLDYCADFPEVEVLLRSGKTTDLHGNLKAGLIDVYFTFGETDPDPGLRGETVAHEPIILIAPPNHRLLGVLSTTLDELACETFS
jgi:DNA-binding transcriptional LysR family regulator